MIAPDGHFLLHEVFCEVSDLESTRLEVTRGWSAGFPTVAEAIETTLAQNRRVTVDLSAWYPSESYFRRTSEFSLTWADVIAEAVKNWLFGCFLESERFRLHIVKESGDTVRLSSFVGFATGWHTGAVYHDPTYMPRDYESIVMLAVSGAPHNYLIPSPAYTVSKSILQLAPVKGNIWAIVVEELRRFSGRPISWSAGPYASPKEALLPLLNKGLEPIPDTSTETARSRRGCRQHILHCVLTAYPNGRTDTWDSVEAKTGYSRRSIMRALQECGQTGWANSGQN